MLISSPVEQWLSALKDRSGIRRRESWKQLRSVRQGRHSMDSRIVLRYDRIESLEDRVLLSGDTLATAVSLDVQSSGQATDSASLSAADDVRIFSLSLIAGQAITVDIDAESEDSSLDALVRVFDPQGIEVAQVDNLTTRNEQPLDTVQLDPELAFLATTAGDWFVGVSSSGNDAYDPDTGAGVSGNSTGSFSLSVALDSGDTTETATPVAVSEGSTVTLTGNIQPASDRDSYRIDLTAGQVIEAVVETDGLPGDLESRIELFGPDVTGRAVVDTGSSDLPVVVYRVTETGSYFFDIVSSAVNDSTGGYEVSFRILTGAETPDDGVGDTVTTANPVRLVDGETLTVEAAIDFNNDADLFAFDLTEGERLSLDVDAVTLPEPSRLDSIMAVFNAEGNQLAFNDDAQSSDSALQFTAPSSGTFFVGISGINRFGSSAFDPVVDGSARSARRGRYELHFAKPASDGAALRFLSSNSPDSVGSGVTRFEVDVPVNFEVQDVNVELSQDIRSGNLSLTLISPAQTRILLDNITEAFPDLLPGFGLLERNYAQVTLNDEASTSITSSFGLVSGSVVPAAALNSFDGESSAGTWILEAEVTDFVDGTVSDFALQLEPPSTFASNDVPVTIPNAGTVTSTLFVPDDVPIADLDVSLDISHAFDSDLEVLLVSPAGTRVELFSRAGGSGQGFTGTVLDDEADTSITEGSAPFSGSFSPEGLLSVLDGELTAGTWILEITDTSAPNGGTLNSWSLEIVPGSTGTIAGNVFLDLDQNGRREGPEPGISEVTVFIDSDGDGRRDEGEPATTTDSTGGYQLPEVAAGSTRVVAETPANLTSDSTEENVTVVVGQTSGADFAFTGPSTIRGTVFSDDDVSGDRSTGERGLANITVFIDKNANGLADSGELTSRTSSAGRFEFTGLPPGTHQLSLTGPPSLVSPADDRLFVSTAAGEITDDVSFAVSLASPFDTEPNNALEAAMLIAPSTRLPGALTQDDVDFYEINILEDGRLRLTVQPESSGSLAPQLRLLQQDGTTLLVSGSTARDNSTGSVRFHVTPGTYLVEVSALGGTTGGYVLDSAFVPAESPTTAIVPELPRRGFNRESVVAGDFNDDGIPDLATGDVSRSSVSVLLGVGDGSFRHTYTLPVDQGPRFLAAFDLNNDGSLDLISANDAGTVSVFPGVGNGTFRSEFRIPVGQAPREVTAADFNGDGVLDLATSNFQSNDVSVLIGRGDATFEGEFRVRVGSRPESLTATDLNGDGKIDLAVANRESDFISVLFGDGGGQFSAGPDAALTFFAPDTQAVRAGDINRDGIVDLITANEGNFVEMLPGNGDGTFQSALELPVGEDAEMVLLEDLTGDGILDLATANRFSNDVSIRIGSDSEELFFGPETRIPVEFAPVMLVAGDWDNDGLTDVAVSNRGDIAALPAPVDGSVSLIFNRDGGVFQSASDSRLLADDVPTTIDIADFDSDGRPDLISANQSSPRAGGSITVLSGLGNGVFEKNAQLDRKARSLAVGDVNRDGRLDVVSVNGRDVVLSGRAEIPTSVTTFLGIGDGQFEPAGQVDVGMNAISVDLADFNGDGILDAVTANEFPEDSSMENGTLSVLFGNGDGSFTAASSLAAGLGPSSVIAEDLDNDGNIDLAVTNRGKPVSFPITPDNRVFVYWGNGDGTFETPQIETVGDGPKELIAVDLNRDGVSELVTANRGARRTSALANNTIWILSSSPASPRQYDPAISMTVSFGPTDLTSGDFDQDGNPDLAVTGSIFNEVAVLLGQGDLTFSPLTAFPLEAALQPESLQTGDLNSDGVLDLAVANLNSDDISVLLGLGDGSFAPADQLTDLPEQAGPLETHVNGDGRSDFVSLDQNGQILVRAGRDSQDGRLAAPFVLNPDSPARSVAMFRSGDENLIASVTREGRTLTLHGLDADDRPEVRSQTALPGFVSVFSVGDLTGDGLDDLVGALPLDNQVIVLRNNGVGGFETPELIHVGELPVAVDLIDLDGSATLDLVVTSRDSAVTQVLFNDGSGNLAAPQVYATSSAPLVFDPDSARFGSLTRPVGQLPADFNGDGILDVLVVNQGERTFRLLTGNGNGTLANPDAVTLPPELDDSVFGSTLLTRDQNIDGQVDQIITTAPGSDVITVLGLNGEGSVTLQQELSTGAGVSGMSLTDRDSDGREDLLVSTSTGDLIVFPGLADGAFGDVFQTRSTVPIAVRDLDNDGRLDVITANSAFDRVNIDFGADARAETILSDEDAPLAAPGSVELGDINADGLDDLIVANTGGNEVFLFPRLSAQTFATEPVTLFSGTNPTGVSIDDVNLDGMNDLVVANRGSNDVTIFTGTTSTDSGFDSGRRLAAGVGPVSADVLTDPDTGEITSLIVTNADEGTVSQLPAVPGLTGSIFNDQTATTIDIGQTSAQGGQLIGNSFVATNPVDDTFTFIPDLFRTFGTGAGINRLDSSGDEPSFLLPTDFNFDGILDLIVANSGDGTVGLFAGDGVGFLFSDLLTAPSLAHPAAMDVAEIDGVVNLFVTDEGEDVATVFRFSESRFPIGQDEPGASQQSDIQASAPSQNGSGISNQRREALEQLFGGVISEAVNQFLNRFIVTETQFFNWDDLARTFRQARQTLSRIFSPGSGEDLFAGGPIPRGVDGQSSLLSSIVNSPVLRNFPPTGILISPFFAVDSESSENPAGIPEANASENAEESSRPAGSGETSDSDAEGAPSSAQRPERDSENSPSARPQDAGTDRKTSSLLPGTVHRRARQTASSSGVPPGFDYRSIDGLFVDVAARTAFAAFLFDQSGFRQRSARAADPTEAAGAGRAGASGNPPGDTNLSDQGMSEAVADLQTPVERDNRSAVGQAILATVTLTRRLLVRGRPQTNTKDVESNYR